jgi:hypothetical protein
MQSFRDVFAATFRGTMHDRCFPECRQLCADILQTGWQKGYIDWNRWTDADVAAASIVLDKLRNRQLIRELSEQISMRRSRMPHGYSRRVAAHVESPWPALNEITSKLGGAVGSRDAAIDMVAGATEPIVNAFGRLLGVWPHTDIRPYLKSPAADIVTLRELHTQAVHSSIKWDKPVSADMLPGRILAHLLCQFRTFSPQNPPVWKKSFPATEFAFLQRVASLPTNNRVIFGCVVWGGMSIGQVAAAFLEQRESVSIHDVFQSIEAAWAKLLPHL